MSGKVSGAIWDLELKGVKQLVLLAMADHADHQGENVRPSVGLIAWKTGYSERQVQRTIKTLVSDGLLVKQDEPPGRPIIYRIDVGAGIKKQPYHTKNVTPDIAMSPLTPECHPQVRLPDVTPRGDTQMSPEPSLQPSEQTSMKEQKDSTVSVETVAATPKPAKSSRRKDKSEDPETNVAIGALIKAWVDATGTLEANPYQKKGYRADAKTMHAAGITPADVTAFVEWKRRTDKFYADKTIKFGVVAADIGQYKAKHAPTLGPGARKKTAAELPLFSEEYWEAYYEEQRELRKAREEAKGNAA